MTSDGEDECSIVGVATVKVDDESRKRSPYYISRKDDDCVEDSQIAVLLQQQSDGRSDSDRSASRKDEFNWKQREIKDAVMEIDRSEFVALDLEFSGLFADYQKHGDMKSFYKYCLENVWKFAAVQLGVCPVRRSKSHHNMWILSPFNFHIFPSSRRLFLADSSSLKYLHENGFDFTSWIRDGFDYARLANIQNAEEAKSKGSRPVTPNTVQQDGVQRIIEEIIEKEKPVIVHNGLLDLMHIFDKFVADIRSKPTVQDFSNEMRRLFSGGVYDTKLLANRGKYTVLHLAGSQATTLECVRSHLMRAGCKSHMALCGSRLSSGRLQEYNLSPLPPGVSEHHKAHEAGFDAMATAHTFLMELEKFFDQQSAEDGCFIPLDWRHREICKQNANVLDVGVYPGYLSLEEHQTSVPHSNNTLQIGSDSVNRECRPKEEESDLRDSESRKRKEEDAAFARTQESPSKRMRKVEP